MLCDRIRTNLPSKIELIRWLCVGYTSVILAMQELEVEGSQLVRAQPWAKKKYLSEK
jgi:hypothetical protein